MLTWIFFFLVIDKQALDKKWVMEKVDRMAMAIAINIIITIIIIISLEANNFYFFFSFFLVILMFHLNLMNHIYKFF